MEAIFFIIVCILFFVQRKNLNTEKSGNKGREPQQVQNGPVTDYRPQTQNRPVAGTKTGDMQRSNMQGRQAVIKTAGSTTGNMASGNRSSVSRAVEKKTADSRQEKSTTEMLGEKAKLDEMEHREEKRRQLAEERRIHGQLHYAERYLPGDMVPKGRRLVCCGYCNAENLIPERDNPKRYNCYFCRETL